MENRIPNGNITAFDLCWRLERDAEKRREREREQFGERTLREMPDGTIRLRDSSRLVAASDQVDPADVGVTLIGPDAWSDGSPVKLVWLKLAVCGSWRGHPAGDFSLSPEMFSEMVKNFERRNVALIIDHEHASEAEGTSGSIPASGVPAAGWIHRLRSSGLAGLDGLVEWLDYAREGIKAGKFAFLSPAVRLGATDGVTGRKVGARLTSAAIVSAPFLSELPRLVAAADRPRGSFLKQSMSVAGRAREIMLKDDIAYGDAFDQAVAEIRAASEASE